MRRARHAIRTGGEQRAFVTRRIDRHSKRLLLIAEERSRPMRQRVPQSLLLHANEQQAEEYSQQCAMRSGHDGGVVLLHCCTGGKSSAPPEKCRWPDGLLPLTKMDPRVRGDDGNQGTVA